MKTYSELSTTAHHIPLVISQTTSALSHEPKVFLKDGQVFANSRDVAEYFGKRHANVLRDIRDALRSNLSSVEFNANFALVPYTDSTGRSLTSEDMTKDGFTLLVMGYTGAKAMKFKMAYIKRFNEMEASLKDQQLSLPQTYGDALRALADKHERLQLLEQDYQEVTHVKNQLHEQVVELEGEVEEARDRH